MAVEEKVFFGGPADFLTVRHLVIRGSNFEIGQELGRLAIERYGRSLPIFAADGLFAKARKDYFRRNYPIHWERVCGVAKAFEVAPDDDRYDLTGLSYGTDIPQSSPGCSVIYYPPSFSADGSGHLSRNYDFSIGSIADLMQIPLPVEIKKRMPSIMAEPYVMMWYPDDGGYASLAIHAFDTLSGTLDGINSAGLVVSILAEDDVIATFGPNIERHPMLHKAVGLHELQVMRLLLDTCATADEAKQALLGAKQYYCFAPCHYIVADSDGNSFVYENSIGRNVQHVIDGKGQPQFLTNFQLYRNDCVNEQPSEKLTTQNDALWRYRTLADRIANHSGSFTLNEIKDNNACVNIHTLLEILRADANLSDAASNVQARTIWHSLYNQNARTVEISFYLGESKNPDGTYSERRSDYLDFAL